MKRKKHNDFTYQRILSLVVQLSEEERKTLADELQGEQSDKDMYCSHRPIPTSDEMINKVLIDEPEWSIEEVESSYHFHPNAVTGQWPGDEPIELLEEMLNT